MSVLNNMSGYFLKVFEKSFDVEFPLTTRNFHCRENVNTCNNIALYSLCIYIAC